MRGCGNQAIEPVHRADLDVALVQPKGEFVDVAAKVFRTDLMINAVDAALHDCENAFNAVRGDVAANVFASAVIHNLMVRDIL